MLKRIVVFHMGPKMGQRTETIILVQNKIKGKDVVCETHTHTHTFYCNI